MPKRQETEPEQAQTMPQRQRTEKPSIKTEEGIINAVHCPEAQSDTGQHALHAAMQAKLQRAENYVDLVRHLVDRALDSRKQKNMTKLQVRSELHAAVATLRTTPDDKDALKHLDFVKEKHAHVAKLADETERLVSETERELRAAVADLRAVKASVIDIERQRVPLLGKGADGVPTN